MKKPKALSKIPFPVIRSILQKTKRQGTCWIFTGACTPKGYGKVNQSRKDYGAHRVVYAALREPIPEGMYIHHKCCNPACVNPDHLELTTLEYNTAEGNRRRAKETAPF